MTRLIVPVTPRDRFLPDVALPGVASVHPNSFAMLQQISNAMGGEIRLHSEVGVGSTFTIVLPLADG